MIDNAKFETLIKMPESSTLDFKKEMYDLTKDDKEYSKSGEIVKDVIAFINTIRTETAYIIFGVKPVDGVNTLFGIDNAFDDAIIQSKVKDKINPPPIFESYILEFNGQKYGVFEFPINKYSNILTATKDMKGVTAGLPYYRMGSKNEVAQGLKVVEIQKWITTVTKQENVPLAEIIKNIEHQIIDDVNGLSKIIINLKQIAYQYGFHDLSDYCSQELTGFLANSKFASLRVCQSFGTTGNYKTVNPETMSYENFMIGTSVKHIDTFHSISILDIENGLKATSLPTSKPKYRLAFTNGNEVYLLNNPEKNQNAITLVYTKQTYSDLYKQVKKNLLKLIHLATDHHLKLKNL